MNFFAINETPINGYRSVLGSASAGLTLLATKIDARTALTAGAAADISVAASAKSRMIMSPKVAANIVLGSQVRGAVGKLASVDAQIVMGSAVKVTVLRKAVANGTLALSASASANMNMRGKALGELRLAGYADSRIVRVHYVSASGLLPLTGKAGSGIRRAVFLSAHSEPLKLGGVARVKMQMRGGAKGSLSLISRANAGFVRRIDASSKNGLTLTARAKAFEWHQQYASASGSMNMASYIGGGTVIIPSVFESAPRERAFSISPDNRTFAVPPDARGF